MFEKQLCKRFGHNYCPDKISLTGTSIVHIEFKCRRCNRIYRKCYPSKWESANGHIIHLFDNDV